MRGIKINLEVFKKILNTLPNSIYLKDIDGRYVWLNQASLKQLEYKHLVLDSIIGKTDLEVFPEFNAIEYVKNDKKVIETKKGISTEEEVVLPSGEKLTQLSFKEPLYGDNPSEVIGVLGYTVDVTSMKKKEEELRDEKERAEAANKAKTEFLENMRHDIRTPLSGIVGFADILKEESDNPQVKEYADNLVASSHALLEFLNEILETIRVASGEIPLLKKKFNLKQKLEDIIRLNQAKAKQKKLVLQLEYDPDFPLYFVGDSKRIQRIVLELVTNALNFTDKGHVKVTATMAKNENQNVVVKIVVEDSGIGIPLDKQQEVFARFKRLTPSYEGIYKGAGLGLAVIKQFIDDLEAEIYVESQLGRGSIFTCLIPLKKALVEDTFGVDTAQEIIVSEVISISPSLPVDTKQQPIPIDANLSRILLIEDNLIAKKMAMHILSGLNCQVDHAPDGKTALQFASQQCYDLIFMDIGLPDMDGYEVTKRIRLQEWNIDAPVPIIALTAHVDSENQQHCIEAGMNAVLSKPLVKDTASDMLNAFIPSRAKPIVAPTPPASLEDEKKTLLELSGLVIDREAGLNTANGDEALLQELLTMLFTSLPEELTHLTDAYEKKDWDKVRSLAHKLKGGASYCGAVRLKEACARLDNYLRTGAMELAEPLYKQVLNEVEALKQHYLDMQNGA